jgi:hypothetical protein
MTIYLRQLLLLAAFALLGFAVYVLLFWVGGAASITILFYRGVALAFIAALLTGLAAAWLARRLGDRSLPIAAAVVSLSLNICFLVLLPVTVDRSVTVYLLSTIDRQGGAGIDARGLERAFIDGYVVKMGAIDRRLDEQIRSGNIAIARDGKVHLTNQGHRFMNFSRIVAWLFDTDPRFVGGRAPNSEQSPSNHN